MADNHIDDMANNVQIRIGHGSKDKVSVWVGTIGQLAKLSEIVILMNGHIRLCSIDPLNLYLDFWLRHNRDPKKTTDLVYKRLLTESPQPKSFGITVRLTWRGKWWASCEYQHPDNKKVKVVTIVQIAQSCNSVTLAIDTILTEATRLGIEFVPYLDEATPHLSLDDDEEASGLIGGDWQQLIRDEAARIGFGCRYDRVESWYHEVGAEPEPERVAVDDEEEFLDM